ncbi:hypothetical protein HPP92_012760 [Vanilla planifolia]|uniref:Uncharacterized protein n=1 Tax=Vanilla planifolia TaxID=51239 RepID=A0A835QR39_VANPL|nr:hypothetical protein HPP92_012760 [Vanilla planifolia]
MRLANIIPAGAEADDDDGNESINQLFLHVDVSKSGNEDSLHFLCGLYPDAIGIHSVCLRPKTGTLSLPSMNKYQGRVFQAVPYVFDETNTEENGRVRGKHSYDH